MADFEEIKYPASGGMDSDSSLEVVKKDDYRSAYNLIKTEYGDEGVLTNVRGTTEVEYTLPAGTNEVIGYCEDKESKGGIFFIWNSNGDHCIARYKIETDSVEWILYAQSVLNFDNAQNHRIHNPRIVGTGKDRILFWTDNYNPPRKLNLYRAKAYTNTSTTTSTTSSTSSSSTTTEEPL